MNTAKRTGVSWTENSDTIADLRAEVARLREALQHSARSEHHRACKAHGEYSANPERYCTCHVQKARAALASKPSC